MFEAVKILPTVQGSKGNSIKHLTTFLAFAVLVGCSSAGLGTVDKSKPQAISTDTPVEFLVTTAVSDFNKHRSPYPSRFRLVHIGYLVAPNGTTRYMLCGEFLLTSEDGIAEWTHFVTIKTEPYEHWLGAQAKGYCQQTSIVWRDRGSTESFRFTGMNGTVNRKTDGKTRRCVRKVSIAEFILQKAFE